MEGDKQQQKKKSREKSSRAIAIVSYDGFECTTERNLAVLGKAGARFYVFARDLHAEGVNASARSTCAPS